MTDRRPERYTAVAIAFHWTVAAAILVALPLGFLAAQAPDSEKAASLLRAHVPLGILILLLTAARGVWRLRHAPPAPLSDQPGWQIGLARVSHALLYVLPLASAASGIALLALSGAAPVVFARVPGTLPDFAPFPPMAVHAVAAFGLIALIGLHVTAVIYHRVHRRERLLARMGVGRSSSGDRSWPAATPGSHAPAP